METLFFGKSSDDANKPSGMVARRKAKGRVVDITLLEGGDKPINRALIGMKIGIQLAGGLENYVAAQMQFMASQGVDATALVDFIVDGGAYEDLPVPSAE